MVETAEMCIKCGNTGVCADGSRCNCGASSKDLILPTRLNVPMQYQNVKYSSCFVKDRLRNTFGVFMEKLLGDIDTRLYSVCQNYIICAPPNSGCTVWAYNVIGTLYTKGILMPDLMDLMQVRSILFDFYNKKNSEQSELIDKAKMMIVRLPMDLPSKFPETVSTIIDRRVRRGNSTVFLFRGNRNDLLSQDTFGKLAALEGDGCFNSVRIESFG